MPDLQRIGRNGPGPQSFTRGQHQQQKPVGCCLTFQSPVNGTNGEPQLQLKFKHEPQFSHPAGEPQHFKQQPQHDGYTQQQQPGEPQQLEHKPQHDDRSQQQ